MGVPPLLLLLWCCVQIPRGAGIGLTQEIHGTRGEKASFSVGPFQHYCEWQFFGAMKDQQSQDVLYSDHRICPDHVYGRYRCRVEPSCNGSFLLRNITFEDEGFYGSTRDGQQPSYHYLHVVDPVCNVSIERIPSDNGVLLYCNSTRSDVSIAWTRDGGSLLETHLLTDNHTLSIPRDMAYGHYQCSVWCGVVGQQYADINLTSVGLKLRCMDVTTMCRTYAVPIVVVTLVLLVGFILLFGCRTVPPSRHA